MQGNELKKLAGFYENELTNRILSFWLPRCEDKEQGGFVNCFTNRGDALVSYDKYTWSQGRFVWMFARLACTGAPLFTQAQRAEFLRLAGHGAAFLMEHCLLAPDDWRCAFLMERGGAAKEVEQGAPLDMSVYADCFVVAGLAMYAYASGSREAYAFAKRLYQSCLDRVERGEFRTLPYPLSPAYRAHGIPMILSNVTRELHRAAGKLDGGYCAALERQLAALAGDILAHFVDGDGVMREVITRENAFLPNLLGRHMNPGHTLEDVWFLLDAAQICGKPQWRDKIYTVARRALETGWDSAYGGLLHFCGLGGGEPSGSTEGVADEPMVRQLSGWGDKLWWVHSEALYTTLRCGLESGDGAFLDWHERLFDYTYRTFPNPEPELREWIQIRTREGAPQEKVVALPVKDPYHITRNLILILELLYSRM